MKLYNKWILSAIVLTFSAVFLFSAGMAGAAIDGGYVGSAACGVCHTAQKADFDKSGHQYKVRFTDGLTPVNTTPVAGQIYDPLSALLTSVMPNNADLRTVDSKDIAGSTGTLDWSKVSYVIGGYGWKARWGVKDTVAPVGEKTGYIWSSTGNAAQYNLDNGSYSSYGSAAKSYTCAICHNTNGTSASDAGCTTPLDGARTEPWLSSGKSASTPGGFASEWTFSGVQCEACHGPGEGHGEAGTISVLKITKGTSDTSDDVEICAKCHVRSNNTSPTLGSECGVEDSFSGTYAILTKGATGTDPWIGHHEQYNEMIGQNDGVHKSLNCTTCHDPHKRATGVIAGVADALGITADGEDRTKAAPGAIKVECASCHYGKDVDGAADIAGHAAITCIDCHMAEASKSATSSSTAGWGRKGDLRTHIFKIDPSQTATLWTTNVDSKTVAKNAITTKYACGKCHDSNIYGSSIAGPTSMATAETPATNYHGTGIASIDNGYVGSEVCGSCHTENYNDFVKSGHPYKVRFTDGSTPVNTTPGAGEIYDPLSAILTMPNNADLINPNNETDIKTGTALDWSTVSYVIGGYGWKARWGVKDPVDNSATGYIWSSSGTHDTQAQFNMLAADTTLDPQGKRADWSTYGSATKAYSCAICHNTNGTSSSDAQCNTALNSGRTEPWASTGLTSGTPGGFRSEWTYSGVQCEACHGAGLAHATAASASNIEKNRRVTFATDGTPGTGGNDYEVCAKCHIRTNNNSLGYGSECGGESHEKIVTYGSTISGDYEGHHQQFNQVFGDNGDGAHASLECTACHNPHKRAHKVTDAIATALGITDNGQSAEARGAVVSCESCHASTAPLAAAGGADTKITATAHSSAATCVDCHMAASTKSATSESGTWGKLGDVSGHIFKIDPAATTMSRTNTDGKAIVTNAITVDYACGRCHDLSMSGAVNVTFSKETAQSYASVMHGGVPTGGPVSPDPVEDPANCDALVLAATLGCAEVSGIETCNLGTPGHVNLTTTGTTTGAAITVWWGDGSGLNQPSAIEHTYNSIGRNQVIVTAANACGEKAQKVMIVNTTGGASGKGTMTIAASGTDGRKISYSVLNSSNVSITNGNITLDGSKSIILDPATNYSVKVGYEAVQPYTDPVTYRSCDMHANGTAVAKCSHPAYATQTTCEAAGKVWQVTGQLITPVAVSTGATTTVSLTNCN